MTAVLALAVALLAASPVKDRELAAREHFAVGRYPEALAIYGKLYAETLHPTYLRNVGRCYQMMKEPARALDSFHEYLRIATHLGRKEREEVQGFIAEMEELQRRMRPPLPAPRPPPPVVIMARPPPPAAPRHRWFWLAGGGLVAAAAVSVVTTLLLAGGGNASPCPDCTLPTTRVSTR